MHFLRNRSLHCTHLKSFALFLQKHSQALHFLVFKQLPLPVILIQVIKITRMKAETNSSHQKKENTAKHISLKTFTQAALFCAVVLTTIIITKNIYDTLRQVYQAEPTGAGITSFFEMMQ